MKRRSNGRANGRVPTPKKRAKRTRLEAQIVGLINRIARLDPAAANATVDILDMVSQVDRARGMRLLESIGTLIQFTARERGAR